MTGLMGILAEAVLSAGGKVTGVEPQMFVEQDLQSDELTELIVVPDILSRESVDKMTEYVDKQTFSLGWNDTEPKIGWTRSGSFSGTAALVKYFADGECWILVTNTSTYRGHHFSRRISLFFSECRRDFGRQLPGKDLFYPDLE